MPNQESQQTLSLDQALLQASSFYQAGQLQEAEHLYRAVLQAQPTNVDANQHMGMLALRVQQPAAALPYFKAALEAQPGESRHWLQYVDALIIANELGAAQRVLDQGRQHGLGGPFVDALAGRIVRDLALSSEIKLALAHREAGRYGEGIVQLQAWLKIHGQDAIGHALLAHMYALNHQDDLASKAMETAMSLDPGHPIVMRNHARLLLKQQRPGDALQAAQAAYALDTTDPENQLMLAATLLSNQQMAGLPALLEAALAVRPDYAEALAMRAQFSAAQGNLRAALADAERSAGIKPHLGQIWILIASLRAELKDTAGAANALEQALQFDEDNTGVLINLGELKRQAGNVEDAVYVLGKAARLSPGNVSAWTNLGVALQDLNRFEEAKAAYTRALEITPEQAEVANNLGVLASSGNDPDWEEAARYFALAVRHKPDFVQAYSNLGVSLQKLKRLDEAAAALRSALAIAPNSAKALNNLGAVLKDMGKLQEAAESYRQAVALQPDLAEAQLNLGYTLSDLDLLPQAMTAYELARHAAMLGSGLDACVTLAVQHYIRNDIVQAKARLDDAHFINSITDPQKKNIRTYWNYLNKLLTWHGENGWPAAEDSAGSLYVIGESHALSPHGTLVQYGGERLRCMAEWISGCKQWHLANPHSNRFKQKFEAVLARLPEGSVLLLCIGEIDCRHDEGMVKAWSRRQDRPLADLMASTVDGYVDFVTEVGRRHGHRVIIGGVPATNIQLEDVSMVAVPQYVQLLRDFNARLKSKALASGLGFLDVYALTDAGDGRSNQQWHLDRHHLIPSAAAAAFERHLF